MSYLDSSVRPLLRFFLICVVSTGWAGLPQVMGQTMQSFPLNDEDGSSVEVEHVFSVIPSGGYTAVRVTVTNKGKEAQSVTLNSSSYGSGGRGENVVSGGSLTVSAKGESSAMQEWLVPLMTDFSGSRGYGYGGRRLSIGMAMPGRSNTASFSSDVFSNEPFSAASQSLAGKSAVVLNEAFRKARATGSKGSYMRSETSTVASYLPAHLPSDWRGYLGLDLLAINTDEWTTLAPGVRNAIRQWVILGGLLDLYHSGLFPEAILQELKADPKVESFNRLGSGVVRAFEWDGKELTGTTYEQMRFQERNGVPGIRRERASSIMQEGANKKAGNSIGTALGERSFAAWQVGVILLLFGLLVGPVNLFYFAPPGRRHRLFFTTPVIALGASVLLIAVIFLQDGSGGTGRRVALLELRPDENNTYLRQYQISRTGVLFGGGFVTEEPAVITPLMLGNSRWTRLKPADANDAEGQRFSLPDPITFAGDWFQSRSEQAQLIETIRPGRGRFELKPGGGDPVVVSSFPAPVERLFYQDPDAQWWASAGPITTGASVALQKATAEEAEAWLDTELILLPLADRDFMTMPREMADRTGRFIAVSHDPKAGLMGTLKSIKWTNDQAILHGRLVPLPAP